MYIRIGLTQKSCLRLYVYSYTMQYTHADRVFDGDVPARRCGSFKIVFYEWLHTNTRYTRRADECKGFGLEMEDAGMSEGGGGG